MASTNMPNEHKNGFSRRYFTTALSTLQSESLDVPFENICGISNNTIFLVGGNPFSILLLDKKLIPQDTLRMQFDIPMDKIVPFNVVVDTPWLYIHFNNVKSVLHGMFPGQKLTMTELKSGIFTKAIQISPGSCVINTINPRTRKQMLQKINIETGVIIKETEFITDADGLDWVSSDGSLEYQPSMGKIVYVEFLRNRFYCLDSNLNLNYYGRTIDTVSMSSATLSIEAKNDEETKMVPSEARIVVNKKCFTDERYIYIVSGLRADNESLKVFNQHATFDRYDILTGKYAGSFHISTEHIGKLKSAFAKNDTLTALFEKRIISFDLSEKQ